MMSMIRLKTAPAPFTPSWYKAGKGPVFLIRAGDVAEREMFEAELAGEHDAGRVMESELNGAFEAGLAFLLADAPEQLAELQALLAEERGVAEHNGEVLIRAIGLPLTDRPAFLEQESRQLPDDQRQALDEVRRLVHKHWPDYRALIAQQARRMAMLPLEAFRRFCVGWEGLKHPCEVGPDDLVTTAAVGRVPQNDMKAAGIHAYGLLYGASSEETRKNSSAPERSGSVRKTSRSGAASKRAGRSKASAGRKTRA